MIAQELEVSLHRAFVEARQKRHELIAVEHLLLALLENTTAAEALRGCGVDMDKLSTRLAQHVDKQTPRIAGDREVDTQPTLGFQRVVQRAILHVQSSGEKEVTGLNVLVAIFGEKDSHAAYFLKQQGVERLTLVNYIAHAASKSAQESPQTEVELPELTAAEFKDAEDLQVVLFNDDKTPMQFVVDVLQRFFSMSKEDATEVMLEVHRDGKAVCGLYAKQLAMDIVKHVRAYIRQHRHPLRCGLAVPK
jgi:ATP-dependent Clp protease adapter protein ClpS